MTWCRKIINVERNGGKLGKYVNKNERFFLNAGLITMINQTLGSQVGWWKLPKGSKKWNLTHQNGINWGNWFKRFVWCLWFKRDMNFPELVNNWMKWYMTKEEWSNNGDTKRIEIKHRFWCDIWGGLPGTEQDSISINFLIQTSSPPVLRGHFFHHKVVLWALENNMLGIFFECYLLFFVFTTPFVSKMNHFECLKLVTICAKGCCTHWGIVVCVQSHFTSIVWLFIVPSLIYREHIAWIGAC